MQSFDRRLVEWASGLDWPLVTPVMRDLSAYHHELTIALAVGAALLARRWSVLALTVVTIPLAAGLDAVLKALIDRPRPFVGDPAVHPLIARPHDPSMPSGHALTAFACATVIGLLVPPVRLPAYGLAAAIAVSRVYLGVHYPSDVLVGAAIGCGLGVAVVVGARAGVRALRPAH